MSTANRTRQSMSFQPRWNGNPCRFAHIDGVKRRPAVDPASSGDDVT